MCVFFFFLIPFTPGAYDTKILYNELVCEAILVLVKYVI